MKRNFFFKGNAQPDIDTSTETALQGAFQGTEAALQESFQSIGLSVSKEPLKRCWNVKSTQPATNNRHGLAKITGTASAVALAGLIAFFKVRQEYTFIVWAISLALLILFDGIHFFDRFLAFQSRAILSSVIIMLAGYMFAKIALDAEIDALLILAGITGLGGLILILVLNSKWLAAEQWLMTEAGQTALLTDVDNQATRAWQGFGRRESRSLLYTLGTETTDNALDILYRPVWIAGYISGNERIAKYKQRMERLEAQAAEAERLKAELIDQRKEDTALYARLREAEQELKYTNMEYSALQKELAKLQTVNEQLLANNNELVDELERLSPRASLQQKEKADQSELDTILRLIGEGASQASVAKTMNLSKSKVSRILKEARESGKIPEGHPAFESHPVVVVKSA